MTNPVVRHEISNEYGSEVVLPVGNLQLRADGEDKDGTSYVRVCDQHGAEIAYWTADEWRDEPEVVMGAIVGALCGPILRPEPEVLAGKIGAGQPKEFQSITSAVAWIEDQRAHDNEGVERGDYYIDDMSDAEYSKRLQEGT